MNARRPISSGVIASIPKVKKKTTTVWIARFWLNLRYCILKQLADLGWSVSLAHYISRLILFWLLNCRNLAVQ